MNYLCLDLAGDPFGDADLELLLLDDFLFFHSFGDE